MQKLTPVLAALLLLTGASLADNDSAILLAETAATDWLQLTDQAKYEETWTQASSLFKAAILLEDWARAVAAARDPLEGLVSRKLNSAEFHRELPGAPDGEYVVMTFDSVFENKARAIETVTVMKDDGAWRVSGYFIR